MGDQAPGRNPEIVAQVDRLASGYARDLPTERRRQVYNHLARMGLEVATAVVTACLDEEERFPTQAVMNRHAKSFGWEPDRPSIRSRAEHEMQAGARDRFQQVYGVRRPEEVGELERYAALGCFRWAVRNGTFERVRAWAHLLPGTTQAAIAGAAPPVQGSLGTGGS